MTKRTAKPIYTAARGLSGGYVERDGQHVATLNDFEAAQDFARILTDLERLSWHTGAFSDAAETSQARWRIGAIVAHQFGVQIDHGKQP